MIYSRMTVKSVLSGRVVKCQSVGVVGRRWRRALGGGPLLVKLVGEVFGRVVRVRVHTWLRGARVVLAAVARAAVRRALGHRPRYRVSRAIAAADRAHSVQYRGPRRDRERGDEATGRATGAGRVAGSAGPSLLCW